MERLTIPDVRVDEHTIRRTFVAAEAVRNRAMEFYWRLKDYEDTGLEPEQCENAKAIIESAFSDDTSKAERIRELLKADKEGRVVVLPAKADMEVSVNAAPYFGEAAQPVELLRGTEKALEAMRDE